MTIKELIPGGNQNNKIFPFPKSEGQWPQKAVNGSRHPDFSEILGSKMEKQIKPKYSTFEEANKNNYEVTAVQSNIAVKRKTTEKVEKQTDQTGSMDKTVDDEKPELNNVGNSQSESILYAFASALGIDASGLQKLMEAAGISAEALSYTNNAEECISKLSQYLNLNDEEKNSLAEFLTFFTETENAVQPILSDAEKSSQQLPITAESAVSEKINISAEPSSNRQASFSGQTSEPGQATASDQASETGQTSISGQFNSSIQAAVAEPKDGQTAAGKLEAYIREMSIKIKARLSEMKNSTGTRREELLAEIKKMMESLRLNNANVIDKTADYTGNGEGTEKTGDDLLLNPAKAKNEAFTQEDPGSGKKDEKEKLTEEPKTLQTKTSEIRTAEKSNTVPVNQTVVSDKQIKTGEPFSMVQPEIIKAADITEKPVLETPAAPREIISQVIEKAKVILTPEKSEMLMDLKPESLGKISLKVASENGIVMAKFVADSQQVKQIIEANMQLLKDSLEKQGFNVQGFSVSVRQDSNRQSAFGNHSEKGRGRGISGKAYRTEAVSGIPTAGAAISAESPYRWGGTTINLTA